MGEPEREPLRQAETDRGISGDRGGGGSERETYDSTFCTGGGGGGLRKYVIGFELENRFGLTIQLGNK